METQIMAPPLVGQLRPWAPQFETLGRASLYVGDLDPAVTEMDLWQVFGGIGPVLSLRLCRDWVSGQSLCYAYVNFFSPAYAAAAITCLNHMRLKGKPIRIMWCERDPQKRKTGDGNLFVKNLAPSVTSTCLEKIFCTYGTILSCKVAEDGGKSKGFGFVQFNSVKSSMAALDALHGTMLAGKKLYVSKFLKKSERRDAREEPKFTNLYVKSLGGNVTLEFLKDKFSKFGELRYVRIIRDAVGKSRGYGFVYFKSPNDAKAAMKALTGEQFGPGKLLVRKAQRRAERKELMRSVSEDIINYHPEKAYDSNLYVKNLHRSISDKGLEEHFGSFGKVTSAKVMRYDNGNSKGFGFVNFSTPEEANRACGALHGTIFLGRRPLYVAKAERKEERQRKLQSYYASTQQFQPTCSILPAFSVFNPAFYISSHKSVMYQHSGKSESGMYPYAAQRYQQEVFAYNPVQQYQQQEGTYTTAANQHPIQNLYVAMPTRRLKWYRIRKDQKICSKKTRETASGSPSFGNSKRNIRATLYPHVENLQCSKPPEAFSVQVEKTVQVVMEANSRTAEDNNCFSAQPSKSVRCLSF